MTKSKLGTIVAAGASVVLVVACAGGGGDTMRAPSSVSRQLSTATAVGQAGDRTANQGELELCKDGTDAQFDVVIGVAPAVRYSLADGECKIVVLNKTEDQNQTSFASVSEVSSSSYALVKIDETDIGFQTGTQTDIITTKTPDDPVSGIGVNAFHGTLLVYTNRAVTPPPPPPPGVCDFITFGRLVTSLNGKKVVISGNIGGNQPGGGILSEFHVEVNGVDNHVASVDTYGPITSGPLSGLLNSRISTGIAKNGVPVEVRMWDGGEPGKGTDIVYVKINNVEVLGPNGQLLDQGNMQFHANCRGPG